MPSLLRKEIIWRELAGIARKGYWPQRALSDDLEEKRDDVVDN